MKTKNVIATLLVICILLTVGVSNVSANGSGPKATPMKGGTFSTEAGSFSFVSVWTSDGNGNNKTSFNPGEVIQWRGDIANNTGNAQNADFAWSLKTPCGSKPLYSGNLITQPGG